MLIWATSLRQLRFGELMEVYAESNLEKAGDWPDLPRGFALQLAEQDFRQYLDEVFFRTPGAVCALWEVEGKYVSALRLEPYKDGLLLEALETDPSQRKKGYAVSLIRAVQQHLTDQGAVKLYSHVNKRNEASLKTHEKCGFRVISDHAVYINGSVDYRCRTFLYEA
ncbi:MAG: GNAT family N-acetyltransferase [Faecousia sp.]